MCIHRERDAVLSDGSIIAAKEDDLNWPAVTSPEETKESCGRLSAQQVKFQKEYIDIIPESWKVVSIT